jgi:UDP-N-acetyl-D-mannosaminuronic acid transferase (WecB/TagA/CpsF family)
MTLNKEKHCHPQSRLDYNKGWYWMETNVWCVMPGTLCSTHDELIGDLSMTIQSVQTKSGQGLGMEVQDVGANRQLAAYTALVGAAAFIIGAVLWSTAGADIDLSVTNGEMVDYLTTAAANKPVLVANLSFWILGALILGVAGTTTANFSKRRVWAQVALVSYRTAVPLVIVSYVTMLSVVVQIAPDTSATAVSLAEVVGWIGSRADWVATILMIGVGPLFLSLAGQGDWAPKWLVRLGYGTGVCGLLTAVAMYTNALGTYGFVIIPVGLIWMIAAGVVLRRNV